MLRKDFNFEENHQKVNSKKISGKPNKRNRESEVALTLDLSVQRKLLLEEISKEVLPDLQALIVLLEKKEKSQAKLMDFSKTLFNMNMTAANKNTAREDCLKDVQTKTQNKQIFDLSSKINLQCHLKILVSTLLEGQSELFRRFMKLAARRADLYSFERPYIVDIKLLKSDQVNPLVEKGFHYIPIDLNEPHLLSQLESIRSKFGIQNLRLPNQSGTHFLN